MVNCSSIDQLVPWNDISLIQFIKRDTYMCEWITCLQPVMVIFA
jgi:hypothetical protein